MNYSRGAKHGRTQEQYDHSEANDSTRHAKKEGYESTTLRFQGDELYRNSQLAIGWTEQHCQYLDSLMAIDFSHAAMRKGRQLYENNYTLGVNGPGPKLGPMKRRADHPQSVNKLQVPRKQVEKPKPYIFKHLRFRQRPVEERERLEQQWKRWGWNNWSSTWWTTQEWPESFIFFRVVERTTVIFQGVSLTGNSDSFVRDGRCKQYAAPRACITCHTRSFSSRAHVAQDDRGVLLVCSLYTCVLESHSISFMFHRTLLDPQLPSRFSTYFPSFAPGSSASLSLLYPYSARRVMLWPVGCTISSHRSALALHRVFVMYLFVRDIIRGSRWSCGFGTTHREPHPQECATWHGRHSPHRETAILRRE